MRLPNEQDRENLGDYMLAAFAAAAVIVSIVYLPVWYH
jgi:hypothetical protein